MKTLNDLTKGDCATVVRVTDDNQIGRRMREMGIVCGTALQVLGEAPLRDPIVVKVFDTVLSVRRSEAICVVVD